MNTVAISDVSVHDKALGGAEAWALVWLLADHGLDLDQLLHEVALDRETLCHPRTRIALSQQLRLQAYARRLSTLASLGIMAGRRLHLTAFGTVGFAMLSSATLERALEVAIRYARLLNMKFDMQIKVEGNEAIIRFQDKYLLEPDAREQCLQLEMAKTTTLLRDLAGDAFVLSGLALDSVPPDFNLWHHPHFNCTVFESDYNELRFNANLLKRPLPQAHFPTCQSALEICDKIMDVDLNQQGLPSQIKKMLLNSKGVIAPLAEVADQMCMSPRTLRRRLEAENTSYVRILEEVRKTLAMRILSSSAMTTEAIAERLGYSDAANFRHAFKRWTGCSPRQYRQKVGPSAQERGPHPSHENRPDSNRAQERLLSQSEYSYA